VVYLWQFLVVHTQEDPLTETLDVLVVGVTNFIFNKFAASKLLEFAQIVILPEVIETILNELFSLSQRLLLLLFR